jgi:hypothetical protein
VSTTNTLLLSSDGIHDIPPKFIRRYQHDDEGGFEIRGLREAVEESLTSGRLFSEQGCPWARSKPKALQNDLNMSEMKLVQPHYA